MAERGSSPKNPEKEEKTLADFKDAVQESLRDGTIGDVVTVLGELATRRAEDR